MNQPNKERVYDDRNNHNLEEASNDMDFVMKYINNMSKECYVQKAQHDKNSAEAAYWEGWKTGLKELQEKITNRWEDA